MWDTDAFCELPARWHQTSFSLGDPSKPPLQRQKKLPLTFQWMNPSSSVLWQWCCIFLFLLRYRHLMLHYDTSTPETSTSVIPPSSVIFQNPIMGKKNLLTFFTVKTFSFELHFWTRATHLKLLSSLICIFSHRLTVPHFSTDLFKNKKINQRACLYLPCRL